MSVNVELIVKGMTSHHCEKMIVKVLADLEGVDYVEVRRDHERVDLEYNHKDIALEAICDAIEAQGFTVVR